MKQTERLAWIDSIRFIAAAVVAWYHFEAQYGGVTDMIRSLSPVLNFIFADCEGKMAVAVFAVMLGYFAASSAGKSTSMVYYTINRYVQFALGIAMAELTIFAIRFTERIFPVEQTVPFVNSWFADVSLTEMAKKVLSDIFFMQYSFFPTLWCMRPFFIASVLIYVFVKAKVSSVIVGIAMLICFLSFGGDDMFFLGICLMGLLLYRTLAWLEKHPQWQKVFRHPCGTLACIILAMLLYQEFLSGSMHVRMFLFGLSSMLLIIACFYNTVLQKVLSLRPLVFLGKMSFGIYLFHAISYRVVVYLIFGALVTVMPRTALWITLIAIYWLSTIVMAWMYTMISGKLQKVIMKRFVDLKVKETF